MKDSHSDVRYLHNCDFFQVVCSQCVANSVRVLFENIKELEERIIKLEGDLK